MATILDNSKKSADEVIASVDATLTSWRSAFEPSKTPSKKSKVVDSTASDADYINAKKSPSRLWKDPDAYHGRLGTYTPETYFAKPLALSPLVCAAFGWENSDKDIIKCSQPNCGGTICIAFHPSLNEESHNALCQQYLDLLVSSHNDTCPFKPFASRWSKAMRQYNNTDGGEICDRPKESATKNILETQIDTVSLRLSDSKAKYYVPPYLMSISDVFMVFEDYSVDGSITSDRINAGALQIRDKLQAIKGSDASAESDVEVVVPDAVTKFCTEAYPDLDWDNFIGKKGTLKGPYLLSTFGWSICGEAGGDTTEVIVKCNMCQVKAQLTIKDTGNPLRKRRRTENDGGVELKLIESHRAHCPFVGGFSFGPGKQSDLPGWKVVLSNLLKKQSSPKK